MALLVGQRLVGLVFGILLLQGSKELGMLAVYLIAECLPVLCRWMAVLGRGGYAVCQG